jgi:hypothetical protein
MRRVLGVFGLILIGVGAFRGYETYDFVSHAYRTNATVLAVETLPGPPKPRSRIPLHVKYTTPTGEEQRTQVRMPLLQKIQEGDTVSILVDTRDTQSARVPLVSELWSIPAACIVAGLGAILLATFAPRRRNIQG